MIKDRASIFYLGRLRKNLFDKKINRCRRRAKVSTIIRARNDDHLPSNSMTEQERIKPREMKSHESANERIYGDASIINYEFIIIAPNSRDGARFARRRDSFNDAESRTRTTTCAHPRVRVSLIQVCR